MGKSCGRGSTSGKSLADFAGVPQRADPVDNSFPLFQGSTHVYSFWHQHQNQTEMCLLKLPNSHNSMLTNNTIVMQRDNWTPQRLPVLITNLLKLAYCPFVFDVSLKCSLRSWKAADVTFELHALEARSWTRSTLAELSIAKGICYLSPVSRVPRDIPGHKFLIC